ncbi:MAG: Serine/threonine protein kinase, partial [Myxococcaceae bacterium]|nr:Serine/threonine protein kinase [Myxococcaceae bacterium]
PKPLEDEATGVFHPRHVAGAPKAAPASEPPPHTHTPALFAAHDEPFTSAPSKVMPNLGAASLFQPSAPELPSAPVPAARPAQAVPAVSAAPAVSSPAAAPAAPMPAPLAQPALATPAGLALAPTLLGTAPASLEAQASRRPAARPREEQPLDSAARAAADAHASAAEGLAKATLMGIGADPLEPPAPFEAPVAAAARGEREHPTERVSLVSPYASSMNYDDASLQDAFGPSAAAAGSIPSGPAATGQQRDSRRLLMYASAAVVGLAVLSVGASALRSKPEPVSREFQAPAALPVTTATAHVEAAQASKPTVHSLAPSTAQLAPAHEPVTPKLADEEPAAVAPAAAAVAAAEPAPKLAPDTASVVAPAPVAAPIKPEPRLAPESPSADHESVASKAEGSHHEAHERARSAKSSSSKTAGADKGDKAAQFTAARDEARSAYAAKNYKAAAAAYERASRYDPTHAGTFAGLGAARLQQGDSKGAVQAYQRAVKLSPETSGFHAALGRAYLANGDKAKAASEYKRALAIDPTNEAAKLALKQI